MLSPSPQWHYWLFFTAVAWLLFAVWRGWRFGLIRSLLRVVILIAAWVGASMAAAYAAQQLAAFFNPPPPFLSKIVATFAGIVIYMTGSFLAGLLFKRTAHYRGIVRWILGFGGAFFGLFYGLIFLWGGIALIRGLGTLGERRLMEARAEGLPISSDPTACNMVRLKASLEWGVTGHLLLKLDPFSPAFYENGTKATLVMKDRQALSRFFASPSTQKLFQHSSIVALVNDSEVQKALSSGNILAISQVKKIQQAFHDPEVIQALKSFDLKGALDYALKKPEPKPSPALLPVTSSQASDTETLTYPQEEVQEIRN